MELVEANLLDSSSLQRAIQGSTYVIHVASPFVVDMPRDENDLIKPAVEGTLSALRAAQAAGVKRFCLTSSQASVYHKDYANQPEVWNEEHWADKIDAELNAYEKSKVRAERAAWKFVAEMPEESRIELTTICPGLILGETMVKGEFASAEIINKFMHNNLPGGIPMLHLGLVSVKDVAKAHIECIKRDEAQGKRFLIVDKPLWFREIAYVLRGNFANYGYPIPESEAKFCLIKFASYFMSDAAYVAKVWGKEFPVDNSRSQ